MRGSASRQACQKPARFPYASTPIAVRFSCRRSTRAPRPGRLGCFSVTSDTSNRIRASRSRWSRGCPRPGTRSFIDQRLTVGQAWAQEIERRFAKSDYLVVFLTADSSRSEMVRGEIEMARHHAAVASRPRILPVRVNFDGPLPYPLNAYLDSIQYADVERNGRHAAADPANSSPRWPGSLPPDARRAGDGCRQRPSAAAVRRAAAGAGRHARRRRPVVSAAADDATALVGVRASRARR